MLLLKPDNFPTSVCLSYNIDILEPVKHYFCKLCETPIPMEDNLCPFCYQLTIDYVFSRFLKN